MKPEIDREACHLRVWALREMERQLGELRLGEEAERILTAMVDTLDALELALGDDYGHVVERLARRMEEFGLTVRHADGRPYLRDEREAGEEADHADA